MTRINPPLPPGRELSELNPDLAFSYELAARFPERVVDLSLQNKQLEYAEVQVGYTKRPNWFPYVSIHTADTDFSVKSSGRGAGMQNRVLAVEFAVLIRDEGPDAELARARLTDLKWDLSTLLAEAAQGGEHYKFLDIDRIEMMGITPEDTDKDEDWGFRGQVLALGTVHFA